VSGAVTSRQTPEGGECSVTSTARRNHEVARHRGCVVWTSTVKDFLRAGWNVHASCEHGSNSMRRAIFALGTVLDSNFSS